MAYDRYDRDERSRWPESRDRERHSERGWGRGGGRESEHDRGFFERAGDEIASWFGGDERGHSDSRGHRDQRDQQDHWTSGGRHRDQRMSGGRDFDRDRDREHIERSPRQREHSSRDFNEDRGLFNRGGSSERDYNPRWQSDRGYRPMAGDYGRAGNHESEQFFAASGVGRGERDLAGYDRHADRDRSSGYNRSQTPYGRDEYRGTSFAGSSKSDRDFDPHYRNWRDRHVSELDRDYDDYRREHQSKFESDFGSWREQRQQKRGLLGQIREHMEVVGKDDEHVGKVDKVAGDRIILTKSDPESGGAHHSISCSQIDRVEGDRVMLDCSADEARKRWRDEDRGRALFEREDQGEMGPGILDRSFSGTYR